MSKGREVVIRLTAEEAKNAAAILEYHAHHASVNPDTRDWRIKMARKFAMAVAASAASRQTTGLGGGDEKAKRVRKANARADTEHILCQARNL